MMVHNVPELPNMECNLGYITRDISEAQMVQCPSVRCPSVQCESRNTLTLRLSIHPQCPHVVAIPSPHSSPDQGSWLGHQQCDLHYGNLRVCVCVCVCVVSFRLQLYSILKSDWSGTWFLLPIDATYRGFDCVRGLCCVGTEVARV